MGVHPESSACRAVAARLATGSDRQRQAMDALSDVLRMVQLSGAVYLSGQFTAPWCVLGHAESDLCATYLPRSDRVISYHLVAEGSCHACLAGDRSSAVTLDTNDLVVVPLGEEHLLGSDLAIPPASAAPLLAAQAATHPREVLRIDHGGGGARTRLVCGFLTCDGPLSNPLLAALPRLFKVRIGAGAESAWLASALSFGAAEAACPRQGSATVLAKLSELLFAEAVRRCIDELPLQHKGWLAGLRDRYVGPALLKLHGHPTYPWTVDELARQVGLSRSALAQRFTDLLGQPPMQYLAQWRLHAAARALRDSRRSLAEIAEAAGYDSEPSFSRAFKRQFGLPPASWRSTLH
jgi:AraC-like DNA-binding protein